MRPRFCRHCGEPLTQELKGRPREFCSNAHRQRHAREGSEPVAVRLQLRDDARELVGKMYAGVTMLETDGQVGQAVRVEATACELERLVDGFFSDLAAEP